MGDVVFRTSGPTLLSVVTLSSFFATYAGDAVGSTQPSGLDPRLLAALTERSDRYTERRAPFVSVESVERVRYRREHPLSGRERHEVYANLPGGMRAGQPPSDLRLRLSARQRVDLPSLMRRAAS